MRVGGRRTRNPGTPDQRGYRRVPGRARSHACARPGPRACSAGSWCVGTSPPPVASSDCVVGQGISVRRSRPCRAGPPGLGGDERVWTGAFVVEEGSHRCARRSRTRSGRACGDGRGRVRVLEWWRRCAQRVAARSGRRSTATSRASRLRKVPGHHRRAPRTCATRRGADLRPLAGPRHRQPRREDGVPRGRRAMGLVKASGTARDERRARRRAHLPGCARGARRCGRVGWSCAKSRRTPLRS